ncbi:LysR family transcriptional regulator [Neobacillus sp. OS1-32]|uniref:LysR family transcriptional regulator n=1 Tax=Neobacillus paridis TaxID=2803862 RepID=A0ABS1TTJ1_9BACI|nr:MULTISPECIES: LysR family transcriptional regulator [Neobacillus]MBL4954642.1 LysR family transcriptional regulator [Neobacillus paridis]WML29943.1 LysR family transcriptional regulator [Neobacillus sp. OS1-32]
MDIKHLQYFLEVAKLNSFSRAADALFITQPTISKMIKNLEQELGVVLFDRSRKQLTLTDAGRVILEHAKLIDHAMKNVSMELSNLLELKKGQIRIGLPPIFAAHHFLEIMSKFHEQYPGITFQLVEKGSKRIEEDVESNLLDVGMVVLPTKPELFNYFSILEEDLQLILPKSHPLSVRDAVSLIDLSQESFILFNNDFVLNDRIIQSCNLAGFHPNIVSESAQHSFIKEMVAFNLGIALLPTSICRQLPENVKAIKVGNPTISWNLAIIWGKDQYLSFAAKHWLHFIKQHLVKE